MQEVHAVCKRHAAGALLSHCVGDTREATLENLSADCVHRTCSPTTSLRSMAPESDCADDRSQGRHTVR